VEVRVNLPSPSFQLSRCVVILDAVGGFTVNQPNHPKENTKNVQ
jgi:hypothetical protein